MCTPFSKAIGIAICLLVGSASLAAELIAPVADHFVTVGSQAAADVKHQIESLDTLSAPITVNETVTPTEVLAALDQANVQKALLISAAYLFSMPDLNPSGEYVLVKQENDHLSRQVAANPNRLAGICSLNPLSDFALDEAQRCAQQLNLNGLYLDFYSSDINLRSSIHIGKLKELIEFLEVLQFPLLLQVQTRSETYGSVDTKLLIDNVLSEAPSLDIQIAKFGGHDGYDLLADRAMGEFIEAFEDGRLEPSRYQFGLADTVNVAQSNHSPTELELAKQNNILLRNRIMQLDIRQVLFASNSRIRLRPDTDSSADPAGPIASRLSVYKRHIGLTQEDWDSLLQSQSRLFD